MKLSKAIRFLSCSILFFSLILSSCTDSSLVEQENTSPDIPYSGPCEESEMSLNQEECILYTTDYQIYSTGLQEYHYRIATDRKVFVDDIKRGIAPSINMVEGEVACLILPYGSGLKTVQFFNLRKDLTSDVFPIYSGYKTYTKWPFEGEVLIAYFDFARCVLIIRDVFDDEGFYIEIDRGFISAGCESLIFLNEDEIYIEYSIYADGYSKDDVIAGKAVEYVTVREVIRFRNTDTDPIVISQIDM